MLALLFYVSFARAETLVHIDLRDRTMIPSEIQVPANDDIWLEVTNQDGSTEEIESLSLKIEKLVPPKRTVKVKLGKLQPGKYDLFGDFHADTCKGTVIVDSGHTP